MDGDKRAAHPLQLLSPHPGPPAAGHCPSRGGNWRQGAGAGGRADRGDPTAAAAGSSRLPPGARAASTAERQPPRPARSPARPRASACSRRVRLRMHAFPSRGIGLLGPAPRVQVGCGGGVGAARALALPRAAPQPPRLLRCPSVRPPVRAGSPGQPPRPATPHPAIQRLLYA